MLRGASVAGYRRRVSVSSMPRARRGRARLGGAWQGRAGTHKAGAWLGEAGLGWAWRGAARPGWARRGRAGQGLTRLGVARLGRVRQSTARPGMARAGTFTWRGRARLGLAGRGQARRGPAWHGRDLHGAGHGAAWRQCRAGTRGSHMTTSFLPPSSCSYGERYKSAGRVAKYRSRGWCVACGFYRPSLRTTIETTRAE